MEFLECPGTSDTVGTVAAALESLRSASNSSREGQREPGGWQDPGTTGNLRPGGPGGQVPAARGRGHRPWQARAKGKFTARLFFLAVISGTRIRAQGIGLAPRDVPLTRQKRLLLILNLESLPPSPAFCSVSETIWRGGGDPRPPVLGTPVAPVHSVVCTRLCR